MDIMRSPLEGQVAPAPWLVARSRVDVPALIRKALTIHPNAGIDETVGQLDAWGVQVSRIVVSMWMMKWKEQRTEQEKHDEVPGKKSQAMRMTPTCIARVAKRFALAESQRRRGGINTAAEFA